MVTTVFMLFAMFISLFFLIRKIMENNKLDQQIKKNEQNKQS